MYFEYPNILGRELFNEAFNPALDTCTVEVIEVVVGKTQPPELDSSAVPILVSAGEALNLASLAS